MTSKKLELIKIEFTDDELKSLVTVLTNSKKLLTAAITYGKETGEIAETESLSLQVEICNFFINDFMQHLDIGEPINKLLQ